MLHALDDLDLNSWCHVMISYTLILDDDIWWSWLEIIWGLEDYFGVLLIMLPYNISLHHYVMTWVMYSLLDITMMMWMSYMFLWWWRSQIMGKTNNGEAILSYSSSALKISEAVTKKNNFGQLGGILSKWILHHLKEDFFLFLTSPYFPSNSQ